MPERLKRPRLRSIPPPSQRLYGALVAAVWQIGRMLRSLEGADGLTREQSGEIIALLVLCRRVAAREMRPVWSRHIPDRRPPGIPEIVAMLGEARTHLNRIQDLWDVRLAAAGLDFGQETRPA
jgi:hypothetical protein